MNDFELFDAMNQAEKRYNELYTEFRRRGLHKKPFCEFSRSRPTTACTTDSPVGFNGHGPSCACDECQYKPDLPKPASR